MKQLTSDIMLLVVIAIGWLYGVYLVLFSESLVLTIVAYAATCFLSWAGLKLSEMMERDWGQDHG